MVTEFIEKQKVSSDTPHFSKNKNNQQSKVSPMLDLSVPPHSVEAEQSVLGGLMLDNHAWDRTADLLAQHDFYRNEHRVIFGVLSELERRSSPMDVLTVAEAIKSHGLMEQAGGEVYLYELAKNTPSVANIVAYAKIVKERSVLRQLIGVANDIAHDAFNPDGRDSNELLDAAESRVFKIAEHSTRGSGPLPIGDLLGQASARMAKLYETKQAITGLATGYTDFDEMTSGLQPADLVIVAGRPSMGKTAFAMNIAEHAAIKEDAPILVFSMEMPGDALVTRMISSLGRIDQHRMRTGRLDDQDWNRITSAIALLSDKAKLMIDDTPALSPSELRARARRCMKQHGKLGLIMIDYLQLMTVPGMRENRTAEISEISRSLKALAKELDVPVIALSQLNRSLEQRTDKRPVMSDLRESGAIEQDADLIVFIYRDEVYHEDSPQKGVAEIIIGKQRNGPIGKVRLTFLGKYTRFENFQSDDYISAS